mgnify:CR=1 FL=1
MATRLRRALIEEKIPSFKIPTNLIHSVFSTLYFVLNVQNALFPVQNAVILALTVHLLVMIKHGLMKTVASILSRKGHTKKRGIRLIVLSLKEIIILSKMTFLFSSQSKYLQQPQKQAG